MFYHWYWVIFIYEYSKLHIYMASISLESPWNSTWILVWSKLYGRRAVTHAIGLSSLQQQCCPRITYNLALVSPQELIDQSWTHQIPAAKLMGIWIQNFPSKMSEFFRWTLIIFIIQWIQSSVFIFLVVEKMKSYFF